MLCLLEEKSVDKLKAIGLPLNFLENQLMKMQPPKELLLRGLQCTFSYLTWLCLYIPLEW